MKIFRGRKTDTGCIVELDNEGYVPQLSLEKSLQVVDHSPTGFQWGYKGSGPTQLAAAILHEVTDDPETTRGYYQLFKSDHVSQWEDTFEINELEIKIWLSLVGAQIDPTATRINTARNGLKKRKVMTVKDRQIRA